MNQFVSSMFLALENLNNWPILFRILWICIEWHPHHSTSPFQWWFHHIHIPPWLHASLVLFASSQYTSVVLSWHFLSLLPLLDPSLSKKGGAITSQDILAGPPDTYHMTSKKYIMTLQGELTNRPDMDNLDARTPLMEPFEAYVWAH